MDYKTQYMWMNTSNNADELQSFHKFWKWHNPWWFMKVLKIIQKSSLKGLFLKSGSATSHLSLTALQRCHFWHFWCVKVAVIDIDIGSVPAESRQWTSHSFACQVRSWRSSLPVISPKWFHSCQEISEQNLAGWWKMRRFPFVFSETSDFSSAFSWAQFHFLIPAVRVTLWLKKPRVSANQRQTWLNFVQWILLC